MVTFAFSLQAEVEKYGAYVGIAAFFGFAVLTILHFAQARELRRLRDWAGRAPERAQEVEARALANAEALRRQTAAPRAATPAATAAASGGATAAGGGVGAATQVIEREDAQGSNGSAAVAEQAENGASPGAEAPAEEASQPVEASEAAKAAGVGAAGGTLAARAASSTASGVVAAPPAGDAGEPVAPAAEPAEDAAEPAASPVPRATPVPRRTPAPAAPLRQPDRSATIPPRRAAPGAPRRGAAPAPAAGGSHRTTWIVVGIGVLVLAVGALVLSGVIGGGGGGAKPAPVASTPTATPAASASTLSPASTNVTVLNGTTTAGVAATAKDKLVARGYTGKITTGNNTDQQSATSLVAYGSRPGAREQGRAVARALGISTVQRLDPDTRALGENADVVVILGQDAAP